MPLPNPDPIPNPNPPPRPLPDPEPPPFPSPPGPPQPPGPKRFPFLGLLIAAVASQSLLAQQLYSATELSGHPIRLKQRVRGFVVLVERDSIIVSVRGFQETFAVATDAKITRNEKPAPLRKLRPRDRVRMSVASTMDRTVATKIKVHAPLRIAVTSTASNARLH